MSIEAGDFVIGDAAEDIDGEVKTTGGVCLNGGKSGQMAFQPRADLLNQASGWLRRGFRSLAVEWLYDFPEFGCHLGNVG